MYPPWRWTAKWAHDHPVEALLLLAAWTVVLAAGFYVVLTGP